MKKTNEELKKIIDEKAPGSPEEKNWAFNVLFKDWANMHEYIYKRFNVDFGMNILDIGSNYGQNFIHFGKDSLGVEINQKAVEFAKSLGLKVASINAEDDLKSINQKFNLIWCTDFLVHVASPYKFLYDSRKLLEDKGKIIIQIPLMSIFNRHKSGCHLYAFNKKALLYLMEMAGYKIIKTSGYIRKKPKWFNFIFEPLLQIYGGNIWVLAEKKEGTPFNLQKVFMPKWFEI
ncbi:MAG: methyltransferase domain-containing protein [Candidatus Pacebacteria bacterium]|nr:methyltransferase domain-containing protein [Candidatus Paceibacterota bacterium]